MNGELSTWAIQPSRLGSYSFPGLPPAPPNLEEHWIDLEYEIAGLLLRIRRRLSRKLTAAVRALELELYPLKEKL